MSAGKPLPYEFHVTIDASHITPEAFTHTCTVLGGKPIILDLAINASTAAEDYMTSHHTLLASDEEAYAELTRVTDALTSEGYCVTRRKIESAPWHPAAPHTLGEPMREGSYFESHLSVVIPLEDVPALRVAVLTNQHVVPLHLSRNILKSNGDGTVTILTTLRDRATYYDDFAQQVEQSIAFVTSLGYGLKKAPVVEYAVYDSNVHHDDRWMTRI